MKRVKKGVTLLEMVIVMSIFAIIASVTIPRVAGFDFRTVPAARQLCADIRYIQSLSNIGERGYKIVVSRENYKLAKGPKILKRVQFSRGIKLYYNYKEIRFNSDGMPARGDTIRVINDKSGKKCNISIVPASGRVVLRCE